VRKGKGRLVALDGATSVSFSLETGEVGNDVSESFDGVYVPLVWFS